MKYKKLTARIISLVMTVTMVFGMLPISLFATEGGSPPILGENTPPQEISAYDKVVELFTALPVASTLTAENKDAFVAQLDVAMNAYELLNQDEQDLFLAQQLELYKSAMALNDAITGAKPVTMAEPVVVTDEGTIKAAFTAATAKGAADATIQLGNDITLGSAINVMGVPSDSTITLDLNGFKLSASRTVLENYNSCTIKIVDTSSGGAGVIESTEANTTSISNSDRGTIHISGGNVTALDGTAIVNYSIGTVRIEGGTVSGGGQQAIYNSDTGKVIISGGEVTAGNGAAINHIGSGKITITGGELSNNSLEQGTIMLSDVPTTGSGDTSIVLDVKDAKLTNSYSSSDAACVKFIGSTVTSENFYTYCKISNTEMVGILYPTPASPQIKFDARNGATIADIEIVAGKITLPADPTWPGYSFAGWYTDIDGAGTQIDADTVHTASATVYAKWTKGTGTDTRTVTTVSMDLSTMGDTDKLATHGYKWDSVSNTLTLNGLAYDATGLTDRKDGELAMPEGATIDVSGTNSIIGRGTGTYEGIAINGATNEASYSFTGDGELSMSAQTSAIGTRTGNISISGVSIIAESRKSNGMGIAVGGILTIKDNATVSAKGNTAIYSNSPIIAEGATVTGANETFTSGTTKSLTQSGTEPVVISFKKFIKFDARNGATIADIEIVGGNITLPADPIWTGYSFAGWYTDIDGAGTQIDADTVLAVTTTVYAKWTKGNKTVRTTPLDLTSTTAPAPAPDQGWSWNATSNTLTLNDTTINTASDHAIKLPADAIVSLQGTNTLAAPKVHTVAIYSTSDFSISGGGTLYAKGDAQGIHSFAGSITINQDAIVTAEGREYGIFAQNNLTINDSTVTANANAKFALVAQNADFTITNSIVSAKATDIGIYAEKKVMISESKVISSALGSAITAKNATIIAEGATVTGANETFISGTTTSLKQSGTEPVVISFGPSIGVGTQTGSVEYGTVTDTTFTVNANNFDGEKFPAFAPKVEWIGTAPTGVTPTFSADNGTLTIKTSTTTNAGEYKFNVVSAKTADENYKSAEATLTVGKATPTVSVAITKKPVPLGRSAIGSRDDTFTIKVTVEGANGEKPTGSIQLKTDDTTTLGTTIVLLGGVATYDWVKPTVATYTITADFTATANKNYNNATGSSVEFDISKSMQDELKFKDVPSTVNTDFGTIVFAVEGGSGAGAVTYASSDTSIITNDGVIGAAGKATITATKAGDDDYNDATATIDITVTVATPYFDGNNLFAVGEPILLINESGTIRAYWDKNGDGAKDANDTVIAKSDTTKEPSKWEIYGGSKTVSMNGNSTSKVTLLCGGFASVNAGSKKGSDTPAELNVKRVLRVDTTETYGTATGFNSTQYKVTFDTVGGTYATPFIWQADGEPLEVQDGIALPTKSGSTFMGFYDSESGGTQYYRENMKSAIATFTGTAPITIYAKWGTTGTGLFAGRYSHYQVFDSKRSPEFPQNGETFRVFNFDKPYNDVSGSGRRMSEAEVEGKIFYFKPTGNTKNPFTLWMADDVDGKNEKAISRSGNIYALGKEGFLFISSGSEKGYFISLSQGFNYGDEITYRPEQSGPISEKTASDVLDASPTPWNPNECYAVIFNSQGAETPAMSSQISVRKNPSPAVLLNMPADPVRIGYRFNGWNTEVDGTGDKVELGSTLTKTITAYAQWVSEVEFVDVNVTGSNTNPSQQFGTNKGIKGSAWTGVVLPKDGHKLPDSITVTVNGTKLTDGYIYISATGEIIISKEKMTGNVVVDISASPISYNIEYRANGAAGSPSTSKQTVTFGTAVNAADVGTMTTAPYNWTFKGWARTVDATAAEYTPDVEIGTTNPVTLTDGATVILYAVWDAGNSKISLQNGSFENPVVTGNNPWTNFKNGTKGLEWLTTAKDGKHEIIRPSINQNGTMNSFSTRNASEGQQFAELNANNIGSLYQQVQTIPGTTLYWGADHRGRNSTGSDTMQIWIGTPADIEKALSQYVGTKSIFGKKNDVSNVDSTLLAKIKQIECVSDKSEWKNYTGAYTVPAGQQTTTFAFVSAGTANSSKSYGNLLDNIYFSFVKPPKRAGIAVRTTEGGSVTISDGSMTSTVVDSPDADKGYLKSLEYGNVLRLGVQAKDGYSFNGGYINGELYHTKEAFLAASNNMSWSINEHLPSDITVLFSKNSTIIFNAQGGAYGKVEQVLTAETGKDKEILAKPTRKDYQFKGWLIAGESTILQAGEAVSYVTNPKTGLVSIEVSSAGQTLSYPVTNGIVLIAQWDYDETYLTDVNVKFDYNDEVTAESTANLSTSSPKSVLPTPIANASKRFVGWIYPMGPKDTFYPAGTQIRYEQNGSYPRVYIGADVNVALSEMVLIAQWEDKQVSSITIKNKPKSSYVYNETFNPDGLVITATYDNGTTSDIPYLDNESKFTFEPVTTGKLAITDNKVTITYTENGNAYPLELPITVSAKTITASITSVDNKTYDGKTTTTGGVITLVGVETGDTVTASGTIAFVDKNVGANKAVNVSNITLGGANAGNYVLADNSLTNVATTAAITAKDVTIIWNSAATRTYDGQASAIGATVDGTIAGDICNVTVAGGSAVNAGNHTATATLANNNYSISGGNTKGYTISKASLTATYDGASVIYKSDIPDEALKVSVTGFVNGEGVTTASGYTAPTVDVSSLTLNVGTYELTPEGGASDNYNFTYVKGTLSVLNRSFNAVVVQDYSGEYDGTEKSLLIKNTDPVSSGAKVCYYSTLADANADDTGTGDTTPVTRTDAGTTTVYYKVFATGFTSETGTGTITITKKAVTASLDSATTLTKEYDGSNTATGVTLKLNGVVAGDDATVNGTITFANPNVGENKAVNVNSITLAGTKMGNYKLTNTSFTASTTASITAKPITLNWTGADNLTYTGKAMNVTATIPTGGVVEGDDCTITITGGNAKNYQASDYTATATISNANYSLTNATKTYNIAKAPLTAKFKNETIKFGETPAKIVEVTGFVGGETVATALNYSAPTIKDAIPTAVSETPYEIELQGGTASNYSFTLDNTGTLTINKVDSDNVNAIGYVGEYNGTANCITVFAPAGSTITYTDDQTVPNTSNSYTNAGTYVVNYTVTHDSYATVTGSETVVINKKTLTPTVDTTTLQDKAYDGTTAVTGGVVKLDGVVGTETPTVNGTISFSDKNVGTNKTIKVTGISTTDDNYSLSTTSLSNIKTTVEITPITATIVWTPTAPVEFNYDGTAKSVTATVSNIIDGDDCEVILTDDFATTPGNYTAKAVDLSSANYRLPASGLNHQFVIKNATIEGITATPTVKIYDGNFSNGVTVAGQLPTDKVLYSTDNGATWSENIPQVGVEGSSTNILVKVERKHYNTLLLAEVTAIVKSTPKVQISKPIFDTTDVKKVTVGGIVTKGGNAITSQSFELKKADATIWTALNAGITNGTVTTYNQLLNDLAADTEYEIRLTATDDAGTTATDTLKFRTQLKTPPTGGISGSVTDDPPSTTGNITVTLEVGNTVVASIQGLNSGDKFTFEKLPDGEYNLVATDSLGKRVTKMASVKDGKTTELGVVNISTKQSVVAVAGNAPPVAADGLQELFETDTYKNDIVATDTIRDGGTVEIRLTAGDAIVESEKDDIKASIGSDIMSLFIDLKVDMIITPTGLPSTVKNLTKVDGLLTVAVPLPADAIDKASYKMYRYHNGKVEALTEIKSDANKTEGSFRIDGKYAYVYASKFSTYAITHSKDSGGGENPDGGNPDGGNPDGGNPDGGNPDGGNPDGGNPDGGNPDGGNTGGGTGGGSFYYYYNVYLNAGAGGSFIPDKTRFEVREGESFGVDIIPNEGYNIKNVTVNGVDKGAITTFVGRNVRNDYTITATFEKIIVEEEVKDTIETSKPTTPDTQNKPSTNEPDSGNDTGSTTEEDTTPQDKPTPPNEYNDTLADSLANLLKDLEFKLDESIKNLPEGLTDEQNTTAIDKLNTIYDEAVRAISDAKTISVASEIFNQAVRDFQATLATLGAKLPSVAPTGVKKPFVLASILLALIAIALAILVICKRKETEYKNRNRLIAIGGAAGGIITFLLTTGWSGIAFANWWTLLVLAFAGLALFGFIASNKEEN